MSELVSVVMPSYNTAEYIREAIQSVLSQTYTDLELIIVDDCSTDNTDEIVSTFKDDRIKYLKNEKNSGAAVSRNYALREAKGKWIAFLDSDDIWLPEKLERQLKYMKEHNYSFTFTDYKIQLNGVWLPYVYFGPDFVNKRKMKDYCYFSTITVIYDREKVGLIQIADIKKNNDYAMWFKVIEKCKCYRLPECLSYYIKHENSISSGKKIKLVKHHYIMFRKALNKGKIISLILTLNNLFHGVFKKLFYKKNIKKYGGNINVAL